MKRSSIVAALSLIFIANAIAGETNTVNPKIPIASHADQGKAGLVVAVTERGDVAADTAWLLSKQVQGSHHYAPVLLVLKPEDRIATLKSLKLDAAELPALIFLDSNGKEINRVIAAAPSTRTFQTKGTDSAALN
jgi:hypothetical protein